MKTQLEQGAMNKKTATQYAIKLNAIYPTMKTKVSSCWLTGGYEIRMAYKDGSYESVFKYVESCEEFLSIHA
jgi:hypothetical protein